MEKTLTIVMMAGAAQNGKGEAAKILKETLLAGDGTHARDRDSVRIDSLMAPISNAAMHIVGWKGSYSGFKEAEVYGRTGRDWVIDMAKVVRTPDPTTPCRLLIDRLEQWGSRLPHVLHFIVIIDDLGFKYEAGYFRAYCESLNAITKSTRHRPFLVHVKREGFRRGLPPLDAREDLESEADMVIDNPELAAKIVTLL